MNRYLLGTYIFSRGNNILAILSSQEYKEEERVELRRT